MIVFYFHPHCFHFRYYYWFIIIFFFLFKKVPNIPDYSASDCFIFVLKSKKISYIFNCDVIYFFFSLKRFSTSLIMLPSLFYLFQALFSFLSIKGCFLSIKFCFSLSFEHFAIWIVPSLKGWPKKIYVC